MQILTTKLNRPKADQRWVPRPRLISALDNALSRRVTLISAPAGYGKTTLIAQWLDHSDTPSAWLSLDRYDGDPDRFLKYLTAAIRHVVPEFGPALDALCAATALPPPDYLADVLIGELTALDHPLVIVFDDFHHFVSEPVLELLARLVQFQPAHLHLVISTRMDPALPVSQWRVRNWLVELRAAELRFREEEARVFFEQVLSREAIDLIFQRTEGWAAGMQLARLSLAETDEELANNINDYFWYRRKVSEGTKGPIVYEFTRRQIILSNGGLPQKTVWLLIRRTLGDDPQYSFFISNASSSTRLKTLVWLSGLRWAIEQCFEETKTELGMDHYEVRKFAGWHHHILTCMLAHFFLWHLKIRMGKKSTSYYAVAA